MNNPDFIYIRHDSQGGVSDYFFRDGELDTLGEGERVTKYLLVGSGKVQKRTTFVPEPQST